MQGLPSDRPDTAHVAANGVLMRALVRDGDDLIETKTFATGPVTIGAAEGCELRLRAREITPKHAVLSPRQDGTWILEATNNGLPTYLNGRPVTQPTAIKHADEIGIANYRIIVYHSDDERAAEPIRDRTRVSDDAAELGSYPLPKGSIVRKPGDELHLGGDTAGWVARLSIGLRDCPDIPRLIDYVLERLLEEFDARFVFAGVRRRDYGLLEFVQDRSIDGRSHGDPPLFDVYNGRCLELSQSICVTSSPAPELGTAIVAPLRCERGDLGLLYVDRKPGAKALSGGDLDRLRLMSAAVAAQLELIILDQIRTQQSITDGQLSFVHEIQAHMDPKAIPDWPGLQLAIYCKPGLDHSGDVYDVMQLPNGLAAILIAHLSGESMRCALAMAEVRAAFRIAGLHADAPHVFLRSANWMLWDDRTRCRMRAAVVVMNPVTGEMQYSTAGPIGAVIINQKGDSQDLTSPHDPEVGAVANFAYDSRFDQVKPGESLALFTEGCYSVTDESGGSLGKERFLESLRDGCKQAASVALDDLIQEHATFFKRGRQPDDITILLFHRGTEVGD